MLINNSVPNRRHLGQVVSVLAAPHQELQGSQGSLDPRDQLAIVDRKDPRAQEETQVIKDLVGSKDLKEIQDPRVRRAYQEAKVNQVLVVSKVHREPSEVIGNSVYLRV